ncbi:hypothetical protein K466DRAFT_592917 [Polyporus arcularius HHB13444]|uniref:Uncharacterized protein n=1 Tax=Polyporus arcularius HHB13444 TaxID=1314778 RepID=A0A5C3NLI7_9APHY|nr:hypothetical protein K466DRAFT_592917 [Polyporus arcularius HHB13444]
MGEGEWSCGRRREGGAGTRGVASPCEDDRRPRASVEIRRTCADRPAMRVRSRRRRGR